VRPEPESTQDELPIEVVWDRIAWCGDTDPVDELEIVLDSPERFEHLWIDALRTVAAEPERFAEDARYNGHRYALILLGLVKPRGAFANVLDFLKRIGASIDDLLDVMVIDDVPAVIAATFSHQIDALRTFVLDPTLDPLVRLAALDGMAALVAQARLDRSVLDDVVGPLIDQLDQLPDWVAPSVAVTVIEFRLARHRARLEPFVEKKTKRLLEGIATRANDPPNIARQHAYRVLDDFHSETTNLMRPPVEDDGGSDDEVDDDEEDPVNAAPFVRETAKVGRNDPCPCRSGKKHKKCCGK